MSGDLAVGFVVAVVGAGGTLVMLGIVAVFTAALHRAFPPEQSDK